MSNIILGALIEEEGYCCMYGYIRLCKARGEKPEEMAAHMGVSVSTIHYHRALLGMKKSHRCQGGCECMKGLFTTEPPPPI